MNTFCAYTLLIYQSIAQYVIDNNISTPPPLTFNNIRSGDIPARVQNRRSFPEALSCFRGRGVLSLSTKNNIQSVK